MTQKDFEIPKELESILEDTQTGSYPVYTKTFTTDVESCEVPGYEVFAAKWERHSYNGFGGIEWKEWLDVYFRETGNEEFQKIFGHAAITRHRFNPHNDRDELKGYPNAGLELVEGTTIRTYWKSNSGNAVEERVIDLAEV